MWGKDSLRLLFSLLGGIEYQTPGIRLKTDDSNHYSVV